MLSVAEQETLRKLQEKSNNKDFVSLTGDELLAIEKRTIEQNGLFFVTELTTILGKFRDIIGSLRDDNFRLLQEINYYRLTIAINADQLPSDSLELVDQDKL